MVEIFQYQFMRRAFIVGSFVAVMLPCMGLPLLLKRLAMMGETLAHASLAGVAIGLFFGVHPIPAALAACAFAGFGVELIRNRLAAYQEISTAMILAACIGLAGVFSGSAGGGNSIGSYLFGSIVTIGNGEFYAVILISVAVLLIYGRICRRLYLSAFDPAAAPLLGIRTGLLDAAFSFLTAMAVSISVRTVGSLIVSSLLILPVVSAMCFAKTYRGTLLLGVVFSLSFVYAGLFLSYFFNLRPGAVIVLIAVIFLTFCMLLKRR